MCLPLDYPLRSKIIKNTNPITKNGSDVRLSHKAVKGSIIGTTTKAMPRAKKPTSIEAQKASMSGSSIVLIILLILYGIEEISERTAYAIHVGLLFVIFIDVILVGFHRIERNEFLLDVFIRSLK